MAPGRRLVGAGVAGIVGIGAAVALVVSLSALLRDAPISGLTRVLWSAFPVVVIGQLWVFFVLGSRATRIRRGESVGQRPASLGQIWRAVFGERPPRLAGPLVVLAFLGWISAVTATPGFAVGAPTSPGEGCAYRLHNHGSYTCVDQQTYQHAGASQQRFGAGILLGFFCIQSAVALSGLRRDKGLTS